MHYVIGAVVIFIGLLAVLICCSGVNEDYEDR